jgi:microcystin-dependent protein
MAEPFLSEIRIMSFNFAPRGWALCNGQLLPINQNQALFSLLGTTYGGNGQTTFALPDLRGKTTIHTGGQIGALLGQVGGEASHTLTNSEMPAHTHAAQGSNNNGDNVVPTGNVFGVVAGLYGPANSVTSLQPGSITNVGGSQPHENRQPFLTLSFCIALQGIFPSRN